MGEIITKHKHSGRLYIDKATENGGCHDSQSLNIVHNGEQEQKKVGAAAAFSKNSCSSRSIFNTTIYPWGWRDKGEFSERGTQTLL